MRKTPAAETPDAYLAALDGWRRELVSALRASVLAAGRLEERIKWGHLVYVSNGPVLLIRAEEARVLFGFWRGKRLTGVDPALKPSGKYELATRTFLEGDGVSPELVARLVAEAVALNRDLGDPTDLKR
ncbi:DUF1801 domain-containing protein [Chenggangzhangella methanolivorans]|uniref:DUF1801 domain-containing protein n=1 Tax=Chenggangzhangella methanolivorans TaxID=1437009 RepID=A0A9E6RBU1_9HYPH|nr:DUF1801 domain-containing protein [Chenggangzhangella methanolivorans]QZO01901.1 DUF1801 domain-containing protein [Chenggangzhangella methanolivorans]